MNEVIENIKEVGHKLNLACPDCGADMILRDSIYGLFYGCINYPECRASHGCHQSGKKKGELLGIPADKETREWRTKAHDVFDELWKGNNKIFSRKRAYKLLQGTMNKRKKECHISMFAKFECQKVVDIVKKFLEKRKIALEIF